MTEITHRAIQTNGIDMRLHPVNPFAPLPRTAGWLDEMQDPGILPPWLTEADLDFFTAEFERTGFRGGLNWYRNLDRTHELTGAWATAKVEIPAMFIAGACDPVLTMMPDRSLMEVMKTQVPSVRGGPRFNSRAR